MKIFMGWSSPLSKAVVYCLYKWMPVAIPTVDPWLAVDAERADLGCEADIRNTGFAILCVTNDKASDTSLLFQVNAISNYLPRERIRLLLFDATKPTAVPGFVRQYSKVRFQRDDMLALTAAINACAGIWEEELPVDEYALADAFNSNWQILDDLVKEAVRAIWVRGSEGLPNPDQLPSRTT